MDRNVTEISTDIINSCEKEFNENLRSNPNVFGNINLYYKNVLKVGSGYNLDPEDAKKEIERLCDFLTNDDFKNKYNRSYNIIDLYLTTNLQVLDLIGDYLKYINKDQYVLIVTFLRRQMLYVDDVSEYYTSYYANNKKQYAFRFYRPTQKRIDALMNLEFMYYNKIPDATVEDTKKAYEILLDLNEKYGVKFDDISFYFILSSLLKNEIHTYYEVGEEYKKLLDEKTKVRKREVPILTKREKIEK